MVSTNKYVTETSEEIPIANFDPFISTGKLVAKVKPRPKLIVILSSNSVPINERKLIDIDTQPFDQNCFELSKFTTRTLRHEASIPRENDGAVKFDDVVEKLKVKFSDTLQWTVSTWVNSLAKGGGKKKRFQYCLNSFSSNEILYFRAIQGHSGETFVDPLLQDNIVLPDDFAEYIYRPRDALHCSKWTDPRRKKQQKGQTVSVLYGSEPDGHST